MVVNMKIDNIVYHPDSVEKVSNWIYKEFVEEKGEKSLEFVIERFKNRNIDEFPISFIAIVNGMCAGVISIFDNDLGTREDLTPWLAGLYVDENFRGNKIAEALINTVFKKCKEMGYTKIYLRTEHTAEYYQKKGWTFLENTVDEYGEETTVFYMSLK
ncbi:GNAT family N-acetyltransferase [Halocella sp. SP3-1]|uniref:GNAT family N-acetyltransferase n=1 Tax=Halocella sp. SP3-1 TaxID=2382161 RepID=UPI0013E0468C|nr:GNAT family N-acetyltransferase [Halocella sp. SP3-1]